MAVMSLPVSGDSFTSSPLASSLPLQTEDADEFIKNFIWHCLDDSKVANPRYPFVLPSKEELTAFVDRMDIIFCPGLSEVLESPTPPSLEWLLSLPSNIPKKKWGLYILLLTKPGCKPLIYIGSCSDNKDGLLARFRDHLNGTKRSAIYVKEAMANGYKITPSAWFAQCPIPAARDAPYFRTVVLGMEAVFSCLFWAMLRNDKSYGFSDIGLWTRTSFEWGGLCSHNPLVERLRDEEEFGFTPQQLDEVAAVSKERNAR